jgi:hypothetical protein
MRGDTPGKSFQYSDLLRDLEGFDPWLARPGLTPRPNDRIYEAFEVLRRVEEASRQDRETGTYAATRSAESCHSVIDWGHHRRGGWSRFLMQQDSARSESEAVAARPDGSP